MKKSFEEFLKEDFGKIGQAQKNVGKSISGTLNNTIIPNKNDSGLVNYMFFQNLKEMLENLEEVCKLDPTKVDKILSEHNWATDHITVAKTNIEQVSNFLTKGHK
jgi:hypothetical protein